MRIEADLIDILDSRPAMTPARLQTIKEIFHAALDCEPDQLNAFLDETCGGDEVLHANVEALLASHRQAGNLSKPRSPLLLRALSRTGGLTC